MRFPLKMTANLARYVASQRLRGSEKFPMVLMLEPLHACNLTCTGCGPDPGVQVHDQRDADRRAVRGRVG